MEIIVLKKLEEIRKGTYRVEELVTDSIEEMYCLDGVSELVGDNKKVLIGEVGVTENGFTLYVEGDSKEIREILKGKAYLYNKEVK